MGFKADGIYQSASFFAIEKHHLSVKMSIIYFFPFPNSKIVLFFKMASSCQKAGVFFFTIAFRTII